MLRSIDSVSYVLLAMRGAQKCSFELRWRKIDASIEHAMMELRELRGIGLRGAIVVVNLSALKKPGKHGADPVALHFDAALTRGLAHAFH